MLALLGARAAAAQSAELPASAVQPEHGLEEPASPTVWLLADGATEPLTYSIELDASFRALPGVPPPDRLSTAYRGHLALSASLRARSACPWATIRSAWPKATAITFQRRPH